MTPVSRRRFLGVGGLGAAGMVAAATGAMGSVASCSVLGIGRGSLAAVFGARLEAVAALGATALATGVLPQPGNGVSRASAVAALLPTDGVTVTVVGPSILDIDVTDTAAFLDAYDDRVEGELVAGELVFVDGFPLTATEVAVAAAASLSA